MQGLLDFFDSLESFLNKAGYIPIISTLTGVFRMLYGYAQAVISGFLFTIGFIPLILAGIAPDKWGAERFFSFIQWNKRILINGGLNASRGLFEVVPLVGNILTFLYDRARQEDILIPYEPGT